MASLELGRKLRYYRQTQELSFRDLKERSGLALGHLQRLERGQVREPSPHVLRKLASALGVSYEELMRTAGYL